jgi:hypothetical protein
VKSRLQEPVLLLSSTLQQQPLKVERINIESSSAAVSAVKNNNNNNSCLRSSKLDQLMSSSCCYSSSLDEPDEFFSDISFSSSESEIFSDLSSLEAFDSSLSGLEEPVTSGLLQPFPFLGDKCLDYCHQLLMVRQDL